MKLRYLVIALPLLGGGCTGLASTIEATAKDQNPVCIDATSPWGAVHYNRLHGCDRP